MKALDELVNADFHDSLLNGIRHQDQDIALEIEFYDDDDISRNIKVTIRGIEIIRKNDSVIGTINMEGEYGSIICLKREDGNIDLVLDWKKFSPNSRTTCAYYFSGLNVRLEVEQAQWGAAN